MGLLGKCLAAAVVFSLASNAILSAERPNTPNSNEHRLPISISPQPLPQALKAVGDAYDLNILFGDDVGIAIPSVEVRGTYTAEEALERLLKKTGLEFRRLDATTIIVKSRIPEALAAFPGVPTVNREPSGTFAHRKGTQVSVEDAEADMTDVVVTGTRLRNTGAADSSPLRVYDRDAMEQSGTATLAEFSQLLPENFNSVSPVSSLFANTVGTPQLGNNVFLGTGFNLFGLGPEATLTLLEGDRWTSGGASGTFLDLSVMPTEAIASVVTLTGDSSAVYGSDAIAGVVNILMRRGTDGNETRVRYGTTTDGGGGQWVFSQRLGASWSGGDGMITYQRAQQNSVLSSSRSFIPAVSPAIDIVPQQSSSGLLGKLEHDFAQGTSVKMQFLYGARDVSDDSSAFGYLVRQDSPLREYGGTVHIDHRLTPGWTVGLYGAYSTLAQSLTTISPGNSPQDRSGDSSLGEIALSANAEPIMLYGHPVRFAFGAGGRKETLTVPTSVYYTNFASVARKVGDLYAEALLPLATGSHPMLKRLDLSLVAREDYYEEVGPTLNPKMGLVWSPTSNLNFRASFARTFRPPTLDELEVIPLYYAVNVPDRTSPTGFTDTLINQSQGLFKLKPETARTITSGLDYHRDRMQGWGASVTWFRTVFDNRVAVPLISYVGPTADIFSQPGLAPYISRSTNLGIIQAIFANPAFLGDFTGSGPRGVGATFDNEPTNIARTFEEGLEGSLRYSNGDTARQLSAFVIANYLLRDTYRATPDSRTISLMNNVGQPPSLRARAGVSGSWYDWRATLNVNYTNGYHNTLIFPAEPVGAFTSLDCQLAWRLPTSTDPEMRITFNAHNILDTAPPWVPVPGLPLRPVGFDAVNASPFGRKLSLELSAVW